MYEPKDVFSNELLIVWLEIIYPQGCGEAKLFHNILLYDAFVARKYYQIDAVGRLDHLIWSVSLLFEQMIAPGGDKITSTLCVTVYLLDKASEEHWCRKV